MQQLYITLINPNEQLPKSDHNILFKTNKCLHLGYFKDNLFIEEDSNLNDIASFNIDKVLYWVNLLSDELL
jgi:hypothetical protein